MSAPVPGGVPPTKFVLMSRRFRAMAWPVLALVLNQTGLSDMLGPLDALVEGVLTIAGVGEWLWHYFRPDGANITLTPNGSLQAPLLILFALNPLLMGCVGVDYDGAAAFRVAESAVLEVNQAEPGSPITDRDCAPVESFAAAMRDRSGAETDYRWIWKVEGGTNAEKIAAKADTVAAGCRRLETLGSSGAVAEAARTTLAEFWTSVGLPMQPRPDGAALSPPVLIDLELAGVQSHG